MAHGGSGDPLQPGVTQRQIWGLYLSHFLSTWNARSYEFAAVTYISLRNPKTKYNSYTRSSSRPRRTPIH